MGVLGKLFGKGRAAAAPADDRDGETIQMIDAYGREFTTTRGEWREKVLLPNLENARDDAEALAGMLVNALGDGFAAYVVKYAERLHAIDPDRSRGVNMLAATLLENHRPDDAERVLQDYLWNTGDDGLALVNLAKVHMARNEHEQMAATLWRALEVDPNQEHGLGWYMAAAAEQGDEGGAEALRRIAALPRSWRARMWQARAALEGKQLEQAIALYNEGLAMAPRPVPADFLMQMSGDLGNHGHLVEALKLATPHFDAAQHGLMVGNNLIKANVDVGRLDHARGIVDRLYALKRPDFEQTLAFWDSAIAQARSAAQSTESLRGPVSIGVFAVEGPVWLQRSWAAELLPAKDPEAVVVGFLAGTADHESVKNPKFQESSAIGRVMRALPLFLSEQLHLSTDGVGVMLQPMIRSGTGGFVLSGAPWEVDDAIAQLARATRRRTMWCWCIWRRSQTRMSYRPDWCGRSMAPSLQRRRRQSTSTRRRRRFAR